MFAILHDSYAILYVYDKDMLFCVLHYATGCILYIKFVIVHVKLSCTQLCVCYIGVALPLYVFNHFCFILKNLNNVNH